MPGDKSRGFFKLEDPFDLLDSLRPYSLMGSESLGTEEFVSFSRANSLYSLLSRVCQMTAAPDWYRIVTKGCRGRKTTIPYIFGAVREPMGKAPASRGAAAAELLALLKRIYDEAPPDHGVRIQSCPSARHVVVPYGRSLTWDPYEFDDVTTIDALAARLWKIYADQISTADYSITDGSWHPFTPEEQADIRTALDDGDDQYVP